MNTALLFGFAFRLNLPAFSLLFLNHVLWKITMIQLLLAGLDAKLIHNLRGGGCSVEKGTVAATENWTLCVRSLAGEMLKTCAALKLCPQFCLALALPPRTK